ncbi:MAG: immunoglobulin domain-containing protein, partial [Erysipelotrichales bacterium]|nr:immunoglobulin domain-containing protein [Erysipelotrichales bacterium]
ACAETDTYTLEASSVIAARNGYEYRCVISNPAGEVISETAILTVVPVAKPVIQTQPRSQTVTQGKAVSFRVVASGENLSYQWYYRTSASGTWMKSTAPCAKTNVYSLSAASVTTARSGYQYRCVVTNPGGQVTSSAAILTVNP